MCSLLLCSAPCPAAFRPATKAPARVTRPCRQLRIVAQASTTEDVGTAGLVGIVSGLVSNPVVCYSLYVLKTTGAGLPPGPGGLYGAIGTWCCGGQKGLLDQAEQGMKGVCPGMYTIIITLPQR